MCTLSLGENFLQTHHFEDNCVHSYFFEKQNYLGFEQKDIRNDLVSIAKASRSLAVQLSNYYVYIHPSLVLARILD